MRSEKSPFAGNAFQPVHSVVLEFDAGTRDEIFHRRGDQNGPRPRIRHNPSTNVDRGAADVVAHDFAFAGVHARAYVDA